MDIWGRGRAGRVLWRLADARTDGVCGRGGHLDSRPRGVRYFGRLDAQAAAGRGIICTGLLSDIRPARPGHSPRNTQPQADYPEPV